MKQVDIGILVAMKSEADILATAIGLSQQKPESGAYLLYTNPQQSIVLITPGVDSQFLASGNPLSRVGKVSAGVATTLLIERYHPRAIINAGTAGGIQSAGLKIGEIVIANNVCSHDVRIPLAGYKEYGMRKIPVSHTEKLRFLTHPYTRDTVSSGESFSTSEEEWKIIKQNNAVAKEMEAAGILQAFEILNSHIPLYIIKSITDLCDEHITAQTSSEEFRKNFTLAMDNLTKIIQELLNNTEKIL